MSKTTFQKSKTDKLIRSAGAFRVSAGAVSELDAVLTEFGRRLVRQAVILVNVAGRKTLQERDLVKAAELIEA